MIGNKHMKRDILIKNRGELPTPQIKELLSPMHIAKEGDLDFTLGHILEALDSVGVDLEPDNFKFSEHGFRGVLVKAKSVKGIDIEINIYHGYKEEKSGERRLLSNIKISAPKDSRSSINHIILHTHPDIGVERIQLIEGIDRNRKNGVANMLSYTVDNGTITCVQESISKMSAARHVLEMHIPPTNFARVSPALEIIYNKVALPADLFDITRKILEEMAIIDYEDESKVSSAMPSLNDKIISRLSGCKVNGVSYKKHLMDVLDKLHPYIGLLGLNDLRLRNDKSARRRLTEDSNHFTIPLQSSMDKPQLELLLSKNMHRIALVITPRNKRKTKIKKVQIEFSIYYSTPQITVFSNHEKVENVALRIETDLDPKMKNRLQVQIYKLEPGSIGTPRIIISSTSPSHLPVPLFRADGLLADLENKIDRSLDMFRAVSRILESI